MSARLALVLFALILLAMTAPAQATLFVNPDGTGDYATIQAAVDAAASNDVIQLGPGTFTGPGNRDVLITGKALTITSGGSDPSRVTIDAGGTEEVSHRAFRVVGAGTAATFTGLTLTGGWVVPLDFGSAVFSEDQATVTLVSCAVVGNQGSAVMNDDATFSAQQCTFRQNVGLSGGAIRIEYGQVNLVGCEFTQNDATSGGACYSFQAHLTVEDCVFDQNHAEDSPGLGCFEFTNAVIRRCTFTRNTQEQYYGVVTFFLGCESIVEDCTFAANDCPHGSAINSEKISTTHIEGCTIWGNATGECAVWAGHRTVTIARTLIAANTGGPAVESVYDHATLTCCDLFGNEGGDWVGNVADQLGVGGNIAADPLLCDPESGDYRIAENSPCAPTAECGLIGAWGIGCDVIATDPATWGGVKAMYWK